PVVAPAAPSAARARARTAYVPGRENEWTMVRPLSPDAPSTIHRTDAINGEPSAGTTRKRTACPGRAILGETTTENSGTGPRAAPGVASVEGGLGTAPLASVAPRATSACAVGCCAG